MNYLITYHYYEIGDILPYKLVDLLDREIIYSLSQSSTIFEVQKVGLKGNLDFIEKIDVEYKLYIADNKSRVTQYANCRLGEIESLKETKVLKDGTVQFEVDVYYFVFRIISLRRASIIKLFILQEQKQLSTSQLTRMLILVIQKNYVLFMRLSSSPAQ